MAHAVKQELVKLAPGFPPGLVPVVAFDTTTFVDESMREVIKTLLEAVILVTLVILIFLQDWRTTLIPALTIPLSLIGTFIFVKLFNFSINSLTLFGLTLAPSLCGLMLRSDQHTTGWLGWLFDRFNQGLDNLRRAYEHSLDGLVRWRGLVVGGFVLLLAGTTWVYFLVPTAFLPEEDQGYFITIIQGPQGSSLQYTRRVIEQVEAQILPLPEVLGTFAVGGFGFSGSSSNSAIVFTTLKPWKERPGENQSVPAIIGQLAQKFQGITDARVFSVNSPQINGLGTFGGFVYQLQDRQGGGGVAGLMQTMGQLLG